MDFNQIGANMKFQGKNYKDADQDIQSTKKKMMVMTQNHNHEKTIPEVTKMRKDSHEVNSQNHWDVCSTWEAGDLGNKHQNPVQEEEKFNKRSFKSGSEKPSNDEDEATNSSKISQNIPNPDIQVQIKKDEEAISEKKQQVPQVLAAPKQEKQISNSDQSNSLIYMTQNKKREERIKGVAASNLEGKEDHTTTSTGHQYQEKQNFESRTQETQEYQKQSHYIPKEKFVHNSSGNGSYNNQSQYKPATSNYRERDDRDNRGGYKKKNYNNYNSSSSSNGYGGQSTGGPSGGGHRAKAVYEEISIIYLGTFMPFILFFLSFFFPSKTAGQKVYIPKKTAIKE